MASSNLALIYEIRIYNNNNYVMTTPLKGLFSVMLKSPSLQVKNPNW